MNKLEFTRNNGEEKTVEFDGDFVFVYDIDDENLGLALEATGENFILFAADILKELHEQCGELAVVMAIKNYMNSIGQEDYA